MRDLRAFAVALAVFGVILFWLAKPEPPWTREPETVLGIRLGAPISASLSSCEKVRDARECFNGGGPDEFTYIQNGPDELGQITIEIQDGVVIGLASSYSDLSSALVHKHLVELYGKPQDGGQFSKSMSWSGKRVSIHATDAVGKDGKGYFDAYLNQVQRKEKPRPNPF